MKKVSVYTCLCACLLTACLTLFGAFCVRSAALRRSRETYAAGDKLAEAAAVIRDNYIGELDEAAMTDAAIDAMIFSLGDQWSYYLTAEEMQAYEQSSANRYGGIGIVVRGTDAGVIVARVYEESAAGRAGIEAGSRFASVGGEDASAWDVAAVTESITAACAAGSVSFTLLCPDGAERAYTLEPGVVYRNPVSYAVLDSGAGYIRVENFEAGSAQRAIGAVEALRAAGVPGIIFDMRANPGGQLSELLELLDHLLPEGTLFLSRAIDGSVETETSDEACVALPMAVLVNEDTYSAAEFFAAALREYDWAFLVGAQTSGKGYAQVTIRLRDGSAIHISHIAYFTPGGVCLAGVGLTPDTPVEVDMQERADFYYGLLEPADDRQLQAAEELLLERLPLSP